MEWNRLKKLTEQKFSSSWGKGLSEAELQEFEAKIGLTLPLAYREFLLVMNGFRPESKPEPGEYSSFVYQHPQDFESTDTKYLHQDCAEFRSVVHGVLAEHGFDPAGVEGFVPLYAHRALVVMKDKWLSPVISVWGSDIVLYGKDLLSYWQKEFQLVSEIYVANDERIKIVVNQFDQPILQSIFEQFDLGEFYFVDCDLYKIQVEPWYRVNPTEENWEAALKLSPSDREAINLVLQRSIDQPISYVLEFLRNSMSNQKERIFFETLCHIKSE